MKLKLKFFTVQVLGVILLFSLAWFIMSLPFAIPYKINVSFVLGILVYALFEYCCGCYVKVTIKSNLNGICNLFRDNVAHMMIAIYLISLVLVVFSGSSSDLLPFLLRGTSYIVLFASLLLTSFLPGYVFINLIQRTSSQNRFSSIGIVVFSVIISFSITSIVGYFNLVLTGSLNSLRITLLWLNALILVIFIASSFLRHGVTRKWVEISTIMDSAFIYKGLVLLSIATFLTWVFYSTHFIPGTTHLIYDEYDQVGLTLQFLRGSRSWQAVQTDSGSYPYFFHLILAAAKSLSNVPLINIYLSFFFLLLFPPFAFYLMTQMIFGKNESRISLFATVIFSTFSGFGWIYAIFLQRSMVSASETSTIFYASQKTYDIIYSTWLPIYIAPYIVDLTIFLVLVGLISYKYIDTKTLFILIMPLVTFGLLIHVEKILILAFLLLFLSVLYALNITKPINHPKTILSSYAIGLLIGIVFNSLTPYKINPSYFSMVWIAFLTSTMGLTLVMISERFRNKLHVLPLKIINKRCLVYALAFFVLSLYLVLSVDLFYSFSSYSFNEQSVPLWFLPLKLGVAGLLSLFGLFYAVQERNREYYEKVNFIIILCIGTFVMQLLLYHLPFSLVSIDFSEFRVIRDILWPFLSVVAAFGMEKIIGVFERVPSLTNSILKYFIICLLFFTIFAGAIPSHLLKVQYFASTQRAISSEEMDALNYLSTLKIPSGSYILTGFSVNNVYAMTGVSTLSFSDPVFSPLIFNSKSPGVLLWTLHYFNISYIYLNMQDLQFIENNYNNSFFMWLLQYFPILFRNNQATIYIVPSSSPPSDRSSVAVVTGDLSSYVNFLPENSVWMDNSFSEGWKKSIVNNVEKWNFITEGDIATLEGKTIPGQQAAVFYVKDLKEAIPTDDDTIVIVKFKSNTATSYAILDIIYSDGTQQRVKLGNQGYMKSLDWVIVTNFLQQNKSVKTIRLGITDNKEGNGGTISVSFDYVAIAQANKLTDYYVSSLVVSLMQINYTTISEFDPSLFNYKAIFIPDMNLTGAKTYQYINWVKNGGSLIIINSQGRGTFGNLLGIRKSDENFSAKLIVDDKGQSIKIPSIDIPILQVSEASTTIIANYTFKNIMASPFALLKKHGEGKILYLEMTPILRNLIGSKDFAEIIEWTRNLLQNYVNCTLFNSSAYRRTFYVKNIGEISSQGKVCISTQSIVSGLESLSRVILDFSDYSQVKNFESFLGDIVISLIEPNGTIPATVQVNGSITISSMDSNNYVKLKLNGESLFKFDISHDNKVKVTLSNGTSLIFHNGVLFINIPHTENVELMVRNPIITINGTTTFNSLFASYPYKFQSSGNRGTFNGYSKFKVKLSGERVILLDEVQLDGNLYLDTTTEPIYKKDLFFFINFPQESTFFTSAIILFTILVYIKINNGGQLKECLRNKIN
jgi:hypothetical protein